MDLTDYLTILKRRMWLIALTITITLAVALLVTWISPARYQASALLRLATSTSGSLNSIDFELDYADRLMNTYVEMAGTRPVRDALREQFDLTYNPTIEAALIADTELLKVTVEDTNPARAAAMAAALADILIDASQEGRSGSVIAAPSVLETEVEAAEEELAQAESALASLVVANPDGPDVDAARRLFELRQSIYLNLRSQYDLARAREEIQANVLTLVEPPELPRSPSEPNLMLNVAVALLLGSAGAVALAFLVDHLDPTIYTPDEAQRLMAAPPLVVIPEPDGREDGHPFLNGRSPTRDAFQRLHLNIQALNNGSTPPRVLMVTSAGQGEGKSTVAANLAMTMVRQGRSVLLIDANLREPSLHGIFGANNSVGLTSVLLGQVTLDEALSSEKDSLNLLCSGPPIDDPTRALASAEMRQLLADQKARFEHIIVNTPSFLSVSDAQALLPITDCVLLLIACRRTSRDGVIEVRNQLETARANQIHFIVCEA